MGGSSIDSSQMRSYYNTSKIAHATDAREVYTSTRMLDIFNPAKMKLPREACDSAESPLSRGIIYGLDVTGSMSSFLLNLIQKQFPRLIENTYKCVSYNPHIMFMGVGDVAARDDAPLQVTQYETDLRMVDQLQKIWLEEGGGGNGSESYILPWYFASKHTRIDCYEKRGQKGFLFTFGNDGPTPGLSAREVHDVFGNQDSLDTTYITSKDCLEMVSEKYHCYHIHLGGAWRDYDSRIISEWRNVIGSHLCVLRDYEYLPELVTTILAMYEGRSKTEALADIQDIFARNAVEQALENHEETVVDERAPGFEQKAKVEVF